MDQNMYISRFSKCYTLSLMIFFKKERGNAFVALCSFEENVPKMTFRNCDLFKRSYTNQGLGFSFNNEMEDKLLKKEFRNSVFNGNIKRAISLMKSATIKYSLKTLIDNNAEEVDKFENTITTSNELGELNFKPKTILVSLHNPKEPADMRATSFNIPLGQSTIVYITPKAREIDDSGKKLSEAQRHCRLSEDTETLDIFNIYTRSACMFECKMKSAVRRCGCIPWNYPISRESNV